MPVVAGVAAIWPLRLEKTFRFLPLHLTAHLTSYIIAAWISKDAHEASRGWQRRRAERREACPMVNFKNLLREVRLQSPTPCTRQQSGKPLGMRYCFAILFVFGAWRAA